MDQKLGPWTLELIDEVYKQRLLRKATEVIQGTYPNTGEFVLEEIGNDCLVVGYLSYYTEEAILTDYSESLGLTEEDIGEPCEYWTMVLAIEPDGSLIEYSTANDRLEKHPQWERISSVK